MNINKSFLSLLIIMLMITSLVFAGGESEAGDASQADASAQMSGYSWPDNIPPEAKALMDPLPLSPRGQVVPGYPDGAPAASADFFTFTEADKDAIKGMNLTAGLVMHTMAAGWPELQVAGIKSVLEDFGVEVIGITDAKFKPGEQIAHLEAMTARKPDYIFSIPIDPLSQSTAYKRAADAGIKMVFLDNVPADMAPGKDYVTVVASDNEKNAFYAATELCEAIGGEGEVGIITLVYEHYYSVAARKVGALKAFDKYPGVDCVEIGTFRTPEKAYEVGTAMLTANPNIKGIFVAWDTPAQQVLAAAKALGREIIITTNDLAQDSALNVARGEFLAIGSQRPYDQGVAEARAAMYDALGKTVPPYISIPTQRVKKINLLSALSFVTKEDPPADVLQLSGGQSF